MKNFVTYLVAFIVVGALVFMSFHSMIAEQELRDITHTEKATIIAVTNNIVTVECVGGNLYRFYGNGFNHAKTCFIIFNTEGEIIDASL